MRWLVYTTAINLNPVALIRSLRRNGFYGDVAAITNLRYIEGVIEIPVTVRHFRGRLAYMDRLRVEIHDLYRGTANYDWLMFMEADCLALKPIGEIMEFAEANGAILVEAMKPFGVSGSVGGGVLVVPVNALGRLFFARLYVDFGKARISRLISDVLNQPEFSENWSYVPKTARWTGDIDVERENIIVHYAGPPEAKRRFREIAAS
jgi:hypothetical protein